MAGKTWRWVLGIAIDCGVVSRVGNQEFASCCLALLICLADRSLKSANV